MTASEPTAPIEAAPAEGPRQGAAPRGRTGRIDGGLERLRWRIEDLPEALDVLGRVLAAQQDLAHLFDDVRAHAGPLRLQVQSGLLAVLWREAWDHARTALADKPAELAEQTDGVDLWCTGDRPALEITVRDNGPGLSAEQCGRVFEPFCTTRPRGSGLGMAIAKRILDARGGTIVAETAPGGGAELRVTLPRSPS